MSCVLAVIEVISAYGVKIRIVSGFMRGGFHANAYAFALNDEVERKVSL